MKYSLKFMCDFLTPLSRFIITISLSFFISRASVCVCKAGEKESVSCV